ncbi:MAG TPA: hypothetical protein VL475_10220, partial [Planctomycetaceae bacterium]|nr:hypothetical protein [Planctomycetaceae bacterium]
MSKFAVNWDLDSLLPRPAGPEFAVMLDQFRKSLAALAEQSERLPSLRGAAADSASWVAFLREFERLEGQAGDLN